MPSRMQNKLVRFDEWLFLNMSLNLNFAQNIVEVLRTFWKNMGNYCIPLPKNK